MIYEGLQEEIAQMARRRIRAALLLCDGNKTQAGRIAAYLNGKRDKPSGSDDILKHYGLE